MFAAVGEEHNADEWRLFIDGSKYSIKAVLLHNGNIKPSIPIGYSVTAYDAMKMFLELVKYDQYNRKICCDLKMVAILAGLPGGYTKYSCFPASGTAERIVSISFDDIGTFVRTEFLVNRIETIK